MSVATHSIALEWKEFSLDLNKVEAHLRANLSDAYCGNSAGVDLQLWFTSEPTDDDKAAVELYWESLSPSSDEATSYVAAADRETAAEAKRSSGKAKLLALGLTEDEVNALLG